MTLSERLDSMKWSAQEKGWLNEWRELKSFAVAAPVSVQATYGANDYVTHCNPDAIEYVPQEETGRDGIGTTKYPASKFPSPLAGFGL